MTRPLEEEAETRRRGCAPGKIFDLSGTAARRGNSTTAPMVAGRRGGLNQRSAVRTTRPTSAGKGWLPGRVTPGPFLVQHGMPGIAQKCLETSFQLNSWFLKGLFPAPAIRTKGDSCEPAGRSL